MCSGTYLPLTAVLGGLLFVRPEGYLEAARDVIRLSPHMAELQQQVACYPCLCEKRRGAELNAACSDWERAPMRLWVPWQQSCTVRVGLPWTVSVPPDRVWTLPHNSAEQ